MLRVPQYGERVHSGLPVSGRSTRESTLCSSGIENKGHERQLPVVVVVLVVEMSRSALGGLPRAIAEPLPLMPTVTQIGKESCLLQREIWV